MAACSVAVVGFLLLVFISSAHLDHDHHNHGRHHHHHHQQQQQEEDEASLPGIQMPLQLQAMENSPHAQEANGTPSCGLASRKPSLMRVSVKHRDAHPLHKNTTKGESLQHSIRRDSYRLQGIGMKTMYSSSLAFSQSNKLSTAPSPFLGRKDSSPSPSLLPPPSKTPPHSIQGHVESGVPLGSGEYFMDVSIGNPPKHFSLIIDTGSDLIWVQCNPCKNCYEQQGPIFSPNASSSYKLLTCTQPQCKLVFNAEGEPCMAQNPRSCRYSYEYGDKSNTTGDLALETITLGLANGQPFSLDGIVFGCGHSNQGLFRGAGGLLGLGNGPLSFPSQLNERFGGKFSYCLVSRNSNLNISSILTFGEDQALVTHPHVQYTKFLTHTFIDTFYYLAIQKVSVGGEDVDIPSTAWAIDAKGLCGTIIDSGTTLIYFVKPAYEKIAQAFTSKISYPKVESSLLDYCYDVSGHTQVQFPALSITFDDGAVFSPPLENYFIEIESYPPTLCLAILEAPLGSPSILGNYLQQNIHVLYDLENHRLGFAPMECSGI